MKVQGRDCRIVIKTLNREIDLPYSEETIREDITLLEEYPNIEGKGNYKYINSSGGAAGCVVSSITSEAAPLLFYLAFGEVRFSDYVSETKNLYRHIVDLIPMEEARPFGVVQDRGGEKKYFAACRVKGFELRLLRDEAIKMKLDIQGKEAPLVYPLPMPTQSQTSKMSGTVIRGERFRGENVNYRINGIEYKNIYGLTLLCKKDVGTKTELWFRRVLESGADLPETIDELCMTAVLLRDKYEDGYFGELRLTLERLILKSDETSVDCDDSVIGPLRYVVNGDVSAEVYSNEELGMRN